MYEYKHQYMIGTEYGGGRGQTLRYSCPIGLTEEDLAKLFPTEKEMSRFNKWMTGQTIALCTGRRYHFEREHNEECMVQSRIHPDMPAHTLDDPFDLRCGYTGEGHYEDDGCKDNPHGAVVYPHDVERYLRGLPAID